jgi:predicted ester cyclase
MFSGQSCFRVVSAISVLLLLAASGIAQSQTQAQEVDNCALVQRLFSEGYNQRDLNMLSDVLAVDYVEYLNGVELKGLISIIKSIRWLEEIAPDFKISIEDIICKGNKVVVRWKYEGIDIKYDKNISLDGMYIAQIENGKISRGWQVFDNLQRFEQLGYIIEAPADSLTQ